MDSPFPACLLSDIDNFFSTDAFRPMGLDVYEDVYDNAGAMFPLQRKLETAYMMQVARQINPKVVYEIGADKGGGLYHWCKSLQTVKRVIACEIRGTPYAEQFQRAFPNLQFLWLPESSYAANAIYKVKDWLGSDPIDILFIDGDKANFIADFYAYLPFMNPNGIVFVHDIRDPGPAEAWKRIKKRYNTTEYINIQESIDAVERQDAGVPSKSQHEDWLRHWRGQSAGVGVVRL